MRRKHHTWRVIFADTIIFGLVFGLSNVISYLYVVVAGRNLLPAEFGVFNALLGLLIMTGAFAGSLQVAVTRAVSKHANRDTFASLMHGTWRFALPGTVLLTSAALPFASRIGADATQIVICGATLLAMILSSTALGFLVGLGKVRSQADLGFLGTVARLVTGWILMLAGFGISGALAGYAANYLLVLILAYAMSLHISKRQEASESGGSQALRIEGATVATFVLAFAPFSLDQFMVQFFNPTLGGEYAATATIAKVAFFAAYPDYRHSLSKSIGADRAPQPHQGSSRRFSGNSIGLWNAGFAYQCFSAGRDPLFLRRSIPRSSQFFGDAGFWCCVLLACHLGRACTNRLGRTWRVCTLSAGANACCGPLCVSTRYAWCGHRKPGLRYTRYQ